jgi:hypothetical protein
MTEPAPASEPPEKTTIRGVVFSKSIRSYYFILHVGISAQEDEESSHVVVRVQVADDGMATELRSWCRRSFKLGDLLEIRGYWSRVIRDTEWNDSRFVVDLASMEDADECIRVKQMHEWKMEECQVWQQKYCGTSKSNPELQQGKKRKCSEEDSETAVKCRHGGGMGKRNQAEILSNFLLHVMANKLNKNDKADPSTWTKPLLTTLERRSAMESLNTGSGVIDAAGGSGHVSMALGLAGVKSTVVDPRESVGKLPGRDRKIWNRSLRTNLIEASSSDGVTVCQPFDALRAWFASRPDGVNESFRNVDAANVPVCDEQHDLLNRCSAIVALHPDEATDAIVDMAVQKGKPFVIVPCCVFARLFPKRRSHNHPDNPVSTYEDLLDYLAAKHKDIQRTELPFEGANIALWASFADK